MSITTTATDNPDTERELAVLRVVHENDTAPQRDISRTTGTFSDGAARGTEE